MVLCTLKKKIPIKYYYLISLLILVFYLGCSTTYVSSDFSSKEKFYIDFNRSAKDKFLEIVLSNDSIFTADNGANISNDSLFIVTRKVLTEKQIISKDEILSTEYSSRNVPDKIILKNGKSIQIKKMTILPDSSVDILKFENLYEPIRLPLNYVRKISYKNKWPGVSLGFLIGGIIGFEVGQNGLIPIYETHGNALAGDEHKDLNYFGATVLGIVGGFVVGSVGGWIIGWEYTYVFFP